MDEYLIVPKRIMDKQSGQAVSQIQLNKEPPEAVEVLSLDNLMQRIWKRSNMNQWEKASQLQSTLKRFLALKPRALPEAKNTEIIRPSSKVHTSDDLWWPEADKDLPPAPRRPAPSRSSRRIVRKHADRNRLEPVVTRGPTRRSQTGQGKMKKKPALKANQKWIFLK